MKVLIFRNQKKYFLLALFVLLLVFVFLVRRNQHTGRMHKTGQSGVRLIAGCYGAAMKNIYLTLQKSGFDFGVNSENYGGIVAFRNFTEIEKVGPSIIVVQHPLAAVENMMKLCFRETEVASCSLRDSKLWKLIKRDLEIEGIEDDYISLLHYWVKWNKLLLEKLHNPKVLHVENMKVWMLSEYLHLDHSSFEDEESGFFKYERRTKETITSWERFESDVDIVKEAKKMAKSLGYMEYLPRRVPVFEFMAADQRKFLNYHLWSQPFTEKRPLKFLFIDEDHPVESHMDKLESKKEYFVVFGKRRSDQLDELMYKVHKYSYGFYILHKDEICEYDMRDWYSGVSYRGYYDPRLIDNIETFWFPLGLRVVFPHIYPSEIKLPEERKYLCNFVGAVSTSESREELVNLLESRKDLNCYVYGIPKWSKLYKGYLEPEEYKQKLLESVFTISPRGHNPECYRIFESIETGSIPIVEDDHDDEGGSGCIQSLQPFKDKKAPFIYISSWSQLPPILEKYKKDLRSLSQKQREIKIWYESFKSEVIQEFEDKFESLIQKNERLSNV